VLSVGVLLSVFLLTELLHAVKPRKTVEMRTAVEVKKRVIVLFVKARDAVCRAKLSNIYFLNLFIIVKIPINIKVKTKLFIAIPTVQK
jgi:hypothetical protein